MNVREVASEDLTPAELDVLRDLFRVAWTDERFDGHDWAHAFGGRHFVVEVEGRIVSHASVVPRTLEVAGTSPSTGYVEAVATHPDHRRRGFGSAVMRSANAHIEASYELGAMGTGQFGFYERLGWERWRGPTSVRVGDQRERTPAEDGSVMILRTPRTPLDLDLDAPLTCDWRPGDVW